MKLNNYSLYIGKTKLISNLNIEFNKGIIHHILGGNGVGKSSFAKSLIDSLPYQGTIEGMENLILIGNYTNIPLNLTVNDILKLKISEQKLFEELYQLLNIHSIKNNLKLSELSDGQRQKIKLLFYLSKGPSILVLDEFTTGLDKKSMGDIYIFLNEYIEKNNITILNITHNLSDLEKMDGTYWYMKDMGITQYADKESLIKEYIELS